MFLGLLLIAQPSEPVEINLWSIICPLLPWLVVFGVVMALLFPFLRDGRRLQQRSLRYMETVEARLQNIETALAHLLEHTERRRKPEPPRPPPLPQRSE